MARLLTLFDLRLIVWPQSAPVAPLTSARSRRQSARLTVFCGAAWFAVATLALAVAMETVKPQWRDPEFAHRIHRLRQWKTEAPDRPLVLAFGSSRTQMAFCPAVMGFPDEPGAPMVYNCGYRGAHPLGVWLHLTRLLDEGPRPDFVLIQLATHEIGIPGDTERQLVLWAPRLSSTDLTRLVPFSDGSTTLLRRWAVARLKGWSEHREAMMSELLPRWQTHQRRLDLTWERMDTYGFVPFAAPMVSEAVRKQALGETRQKFAAAIRGRKPGSVSDRAYRDLIARCQTEGIPVAFFVAPESPTLRSWYRPAALKIEAEYHRSLVERGVPVFPAPTHLAEDDFADGYHMLRHGAEKYSQWLAEHHLKPWLAAYGLKVR